MRSFIIVCLLVLLGQTAQATPMKVITVGGALTEIVYALGAEEALVGNDTTSYYPAAAEKLPKIGYQRALSAEGVLSLSPDMIILTEEAGPPAVLLQLQSTGVRLLKLKAGRNVDDVKENVRIIGDALDRKAKADLLIAELRDAEKKLAKVVRGISKRPGVMFILSYAGGSPMAAGGGTAADSIIALAGGRNVIDAYTGYKPLSPESAIAAAPDIILITSQGLANIGGREALKQVPGLALTPALKAGRIVELDSLLLLGFGPRTVEAATTLHNKFTTQ